jgi:hypothetical protein
VQHVVERVDARRVHVEGQLATITRELRDRVRDVNRRINELEREIRSLIRHLATALLTIPGCGALTAAKLVGETAAATRFRSTSAYARWSGTAPSPAPWPALSLSRPFNPPLDEDRPRGRSRAPLVRVASSRGSRRRRTTRFGRDCWPQGQP